MSSGPFQSIWVYRVSLWDSCFAYIFSFLHICFLWIHFFPFRLFLLNTELSVIFNLCFYCTFGTFWIYLWSFVFFFFFVCVRCIFQHFFSNLPIIFQFQCAIAICTYFYFDDKLPFFYPATVKFDRDERRIIAEIARQKDLESKGIVFVMIIATNKHFNVAIKQRSSFIDKTNK